MQALSACLPPLYGTCGFNDSMRGSTPPLHHTPNFVGVIVHWCHLTFIPRSPSWAPKYSQFLSGFLDSLVSHAAPFSGLPDSPVPWSVPCLGFWSLLFPYTAPLWVPGLCAILSPSLWAGGPPSSTLTPTVDHGPSGPVCSPSWNCGPFGPALSHSLGLENP